VRRAEELFRQLVLVEAKSTRDDTWVGNSHDSGPNDERKGLSGLAIRRPFTRVGDVLQSPEKKRPVKAGSGLAG